MIHGQIFKKGALMTEMSNVKHYVLPPDASQILRKASQTPNTPEDPLSKEKAINHAVAKIKTMYPHLFTDEL